MAPTPALRSRLVALLPVLCVAAGAIGAAPAAGAGSAGGTAAATIESLAQALPGQAYAAVGVALLGAVALWLFGAKLLKQAFAVLGLAVGGMTGLVLLPSVGLDDVGGAAGWLVGLLSGAAVGLVLALVTLKLAVTLASGLAFAVAGLVAALVYVQHMPAGGGSGPGPGGTTGAPSALFSTVAPGSGRTPAEAAAALSTESLTRFFEPLSGVADRLRGVAEQGGTIVSARWEALPPKSKVVVLGSTTAGFAFGLLVGFFLPKRSAALVTALLGSALTLVCAGMLVDAYGTPGLRGIFDQSPQTWAIVWAIASLIGMVVQLSGFGKRRGKRSDDEGDGDDE